ncbi:phosphate ABC transporter permease PstA [Aestuariibacter sp. A3R04]|uniref:phosphate ABC transporter permease PstA n=1 Tax=Aestuariibacter sp. A3R04 TaxID=2841571 RepID=UPI001C0908F9|nr:phosphate ABC transporter permease PstA [Aestuariibacter sp. A3R04]MBU3020884.1 phosphate ABC transporter permease PstA [Aestuariibacter sp. A3R04]
MINDKIKSLLNPAQRQSFVISVTAFFSTLLLLVLGSILALVIYRGTAYFWPEPIYSVAFVSQQDNRATVVYAQIYSEFEEDGKQVRWLRYSHEDNPFGTQILLDEKDTLSVIESANGANITLNDGLSVMGVPVRINGSASAAFSEQHYEVMRKKVDEIDASITDIRTRWLSEIHQKLAELDQLNVARDAPAREKLNDAFHQWQSRIIAMENERDNFSIEVAMADGAVVPIALARIQDIVFPGQLSFVGKIAVTFTKIGQFLSQSPKQANTAGGVFPALFGTVLMVFLMTIIVTPFGVLAAVYLSEYAPNTLLTGVIRVSVANMAGVPSIVYGVFGLGFFVYTMGGNIDALFFSDSLPAPTLGTPGLFWASLTMAMLTLPVVIVATEEGLRQVPTGLRAGSYALGATKAETIIYTVLPIASPGIMTGVILAIARAAGEVAPLMIVGAVKFAPNLPFDGEFPYLHLDRQFMHLGVLIYDGAFHSQTDAKGASMMFATCLLLLLVVLVLNVLAVLLRARLRKRYLTN